MSEERPPASYHRDVWERFTAALEPGMGVSRWRSFSDGRAKVWFRASYKTSLFWLLFGIVLFGLAALSKGGNWVAFLIFGIGFCLWAGWLHGDLLGNPVCLTPDGLRRPFPLWRRARIGRPVSLALNYSREGLVGEEYFVRLVDMEGKIFAFPILGMYDALPAWTTAFFLSYWYRLPIHLEGLDACPEFALEHVRPLTKGLDEDPLDRIVFQESGEVEPTPSS